MAAAGAVGAPASAAPAPVDLLFDFQCAGNPVAAGFSEVAPGTTYSPERGFGLTTALASNACRDRGTGTREDRDFLLPVDSTRFVADVPDGVYTLVLHTGDAIASSNTGLVANGVTLPSSSPGSGNVVRRTLEGVPVTDGRLEVRFTGSSMRVNALQVLSPVAAPSGLAATVHATATPSVDLSWDAAPDAAGYRVQRADDGGAPARVADLPAGTTSWTDTGVALAHGYVYTVTTVGATGRESDPSEPAEVSVVDPDGAAPSVPQGVTADGATLTWQPVEGAVAYDVYRARAGGFQPTLQERVTGTSWTDESAEPTVSYAYEVAAVGVGGRSERSERVQVPASVELSRQAERIDRSPVAVATDEGVYVGWRLLGDDPYDVAFHVYRDGERITDEPVTDSTNLVDPDGTAGSTYRVSTVDGEIEHWATDEVEVWESQTLDVPLQVPDGGSTPDGVAYTYRANDASVGDVDGDGEYEIVLKWDPSNSKDNSQSGYTGNVHVDAYELDGTHLWRVDLGRNIRAGAHYTQFQVYDYDGDGRAEVVMKTADGTVDGEGIVIGDADADHRNSGGYVLGGPEYLTVFDGATGAAIDTIGYVPPRGNVGAWGDSYGNRVDRFLATTAYLDGERPSAVFARGYYTRAVVAAFDFDGENLTQRWVFDSDAAGSQYRGQGNHDMQVADVDGDQKDEIVFGSMTLDDDGTALYNTGLGHGDAMHVSDFDPSRPGLETFSAHESMSQSGNRGATFRDAATGEVIWAIPATRDTGRAAMGDIDPRHDGAEGWAVGADGAWSSPVGQLRSSTGELVSNSIPKANFLTWWDGDLLREIGDHDWDADAGAGVPTISKWDWEAEESVEVYRAEGTYSNNGTKGNFALQADLFGDWREEIVTRTEDSTALRVATTVIPTDHRLRTPMSDPQYRLAVAWQNTAYNQPPHTSYFVGAGMERPPAPRLAFTNEAPVAERVPGPATDATERVVLRVTSERKDALTGGPVTLTATIDEGDNAQAMSLYVDGELVGTRELADRTPSRQAAQFEVDGLEPGMRTLHVEAVNQHGESSSNPVRLRVR